MCARALKRDKCYTNGSTENCKVSGFVHTMSDNFLCRHENLSGVVWTPIRYVFLHFRDRRGAALLRYSEKSRQNHHSYVWTETSSIWYGFGAGAKAILYSVNIALILAPLATAGATRTKIQTKNKNSTMVSDTWVRNDEKEAKALLTRLAAQVVLHSRCWTSIAGV